MITIIAVVIAYALGVVLSSPTKKLFGVGIQKSEEAIDQLNKPKE